MLKILTSFFKYPSFFKNAYLFFRMPVFLILLYNISSCHLAVSPLKGNHITHPDLIHQLNLHLLEAIVQDGFTPPVASRIYAYPNIAAYEVLAQQDSSFKTLSGQIHDFQLQIATQNPNSFYKEVTMVKAFCEVAVHLVYRDYLIEKAEESILENLGQDFKNEQAFQKSLALGEDMARQIKGWADTDGYNKTRTMPKFTTADTLGSWQPTPPKYGEAIEPHWHLIRPFVVDSNSQFRISLPFKYSDEVDAPFFKLVKEVYDIANNATEEQIAIARFWDCNPSPSVIQGHLMTTNRQNTPGGHWIGISRLAATSQNLPLIESCAVYAQVSIAIADAFKAAWDTKYATNFVRPETVIHEHIDPSWQTKLETPLFPEFTSAHSLVSTAAATVLTARFGKQFTYTDSVNVPFWLSASSLCLLL